MQKDSVKQHHKGRTTVISPLQMHPLALHLNHIVCVIFGWVGSVQCTYYIHVHCLVPVYWILLIIAAITSFLLTMHDNSNKTKLASLSAYLCHFHPLAGPGSN